MDRTTSDIRKMVSGISPETPDFTQTDNRILEVVNALCDVIDSQERRITSLEREIYSHFGDVI